jgi:hypothetical protein
VDPSKAPVSERIERRRMHFAMRASLVWRRNIASIGPLPCVGDRGDRWP